jgi:PAS domain S-box-containing protein
MLLESASTEFIIEWVADYGAALDALHSREFDVCLLNNLSKERNGLELMQEAVNLGVTTPIVFLANRRDSDSDLAAITRGAVDCLAKSELSTITLERSIRRAIGLRLRKAQMQAEESLRDANVDLERRVEERTAELIKVNAELMREVEERRQADDALWLSERRLRRAEVVARTGNWEFILGRDKAKASEGARIIYGLEGSEWSLLEVQRLPLPEYRGMLDEALKGLIEEGKPYNVEFKIRRPSDGKIMDIHSIAEYSPEKGVVFGVIQDITERKQMEKALLASEERLRTLINSTPDIVCFKDAEGRWLEANEAVLELFELKGVDYRGRKDAELAEFSKFYREAFLACETTDEQTWQKHALTRGEEIIPHPNGTAMVYDMIKVPLFHPDGRCKGLVVLGRDISERKRIEGELRVKELKYRTLFEAANDGIFLQDTTGFVDCNQKGANMYGLTREEVIARAPAELSPERQPDGRLSWEAAGERLLAALNGEPQVFEWQSLRADGVPFDVEITLNRVELGGSVLLQAIVRDITERKRMEVTLRDSETRLRAITDSARDAILMMDPEGMITYWNPAAERILGYTKEEANGQNLHRLLAPQRYHAQYDAAFPRFVKTGRGDATGKTIQLVARRKDGEEIPVELSLSAVFMNGWQAVGLLRDITERKRAEDALRESEAKYRLISENTGDVIWQFDLETNQFVYVSPSVHRLLRYTPEEMVGKNMEAVLTPASMQFVRKRLPEVIAAFTAGDQSVRVLTNGLDHVRKDGSVVPTEVVTTLLQDATGQTARIVGVTRDITEQRHAAERLRESEEKYRLFVETALEGMWAMDAEQRITFVNQVVCDMLGYGMEEIVGRNVAAFIAEDHLEDHKSRMAARSKGISEKYECKFRRKDGGDLWLIVSVRALMGENGGFQGAFSMLTDITERKQAEKEREELEGKLRQAQKLEAIGTLAGGIAHDFNNILVPIIGYAEMALGDTSQFNPMRYGLEQILNAALRARDLVKQILVFGRSGKEQQKLPVEVSSIIKEVLRLLRASLPSSIEIRQNIENGVAAADATQIHQVLINLCTNAAHAMGDKGILGVSLSHADLGKSDLADKSTFDLKPGRYIKLCVSDTGSGIDSPTMQRIFDPYFTTKEVGKGSGLGLAVVHGIVRRHDGAVTVQSEPGKGTTFSVYIPAVEAGTLVRAEPGQALPTGTETILLVDDEQIVVKMGTAILERLGYTVIPETNSLRALEIFRARPGEIDLIITDYTMPKLTGTDLSKEIRQIRPEIPIILCTGFSEKVTESVAIDLGVELVMKPYPVKQIAELVRKVLRVQES